MDGGRRLRVDGRVLGDDSEMGDDLDDNDEGEGRLCLLEATAEGCSKLKDRLYGGRRVDIIG